MMLDAIVTAGGDPAHDTELLAYARDATGRAAPRKALIEVGGKTLLEHVVDALHGSGRVRRVVVVGLPPEHRPDLGEDVTFLPDTGSMLGNGRAGVEYFQSTGEISERLIAASSDIPLITPPIVDGMLDQCLAYDADFCYNVVEQSVMECAFPGSGRTFVPIEGKRYAGGDINLVRTRIVASNLDKLDQIIGQRKSFWRQLSFVGLDTVFLFLIRRLTIAQIERRVEKVLGFSGKVVISPYAEVAMDIDKPHHLDVVRSAYASASATANAGYQGTSGL